MASATSVKPKSVKRCDIDGLREDHELDGRWELRRKFLVAHRKTFDRSRLQCLSNTYCNIVLTGCTYPPAVMERIAQLSENLDKPDSDSSRAASPVPDEPPVSEKPKKSRDKKKKKKKDKEPEVLAAVTENKPEMPEEEEEEAAAAPEQVKKKKRRPRKKKIVAMFERLEVENKSTSEESVAKPCKEKKKKKEPMQPPQPKVSYGPLVAKGPKVTYGPLVTGAISKN